ncbi:TonB-dependent receptor [Duganella radicis]|uniref:TonB-dependent receptor n=1 Tax=Duganella radicis TaxID=551988 RepID=A0A6L6PDK2_9BURK|nr:TonB-dependent receptor [Duganella radicis]MTV36993.1 TonB-dependent receptor [Duganella radicis]
MKKCNWSYSAPLLALNLALNMAYGSFATAATLADNADEQQPEPAPAAAVKDQAIPEVVVTSQRRATKVQDIPIATTVLSGDQLKAQSVVRLADLQTASPALTVVDAGLVSSVNIRGIGLASGSPNVANGVATYVDGLFQPPLVSAASYYDIANVEILRGPQGTLVGNSSTGGAVLITTQNPRLSGMEGYAEAGFGSYNARNLQGAINVPLSDTLAIRLAGNHRTRDSYYTDHGVYHNTPGKLDENAGRFGLLWKPGKFQALLKIDDVERKSGGVVGKPVPGSANDFGASGGVFDLDYNSPTRFNERGLMNSLELKYELDNGVVLRSLSGYQDKKISAGYDQDMSARLSNYMDQIVRERESSQEFNLISPTTGRFNWILGAYFQQNTIDVTILQTSAGPQVNVDGKNKKRVTGLFAQTGYKLTDDLELQFGLRRSTFKATGEGGVFIGRGLPVFPAGGLQVADLTAAYEDSKPTGKLALNWKTDRNNLLYAFAARGYKPGNANSATTKFDPETVMNYELGWKSTMAEGRVRTQLDVFYNDYKNFQLDFLDTATGQNNPANLPPSTIKGIEGQIQAKLNGFGINAGFAYVDSKMGAISLVDVLSLPAGLLGPQCAAGTPSNPPICFNYGPYIYANQGGPNLMSPKLTYNLGIDYKFAFENGTSLTPRLNFSHIGDSYFYATYQPNSHVAARNLMSALLTLRHDDWTAELFVNNLADKRYVAGGSGTSLFYGAPREFGFRLNKEF